MDRLTAKSLALFKEALAPGNNDPMLLRKAFTQSGTATTGLTAYSLEAPAKNTFPVLTPLRNIIPRVSGGEGIQANWKAVTGINTTGVSVGVSEGNRGGIVTTSTADYLAKFAGIGLEDYVTFEADYAAKGFEDIRALAASNLLSAVMIGEEAMILGGQGTWALGTTPTPVGVLTAGGAMTAQATLCFVVALTLEGYRRSSVAAGLPGPISRLSAGPYSNTDTVNGGNAKVSLVSNTITTAGGNLSVTWTVAAVPGAVAYAWYTGPTGAATCVLTAITTGPKFIQTADGLGTQAANNSKVTTDYSQNSLGFDGLISIATKSGSGAYYKDFAGADFATSGNDGSIVEIDNALTSFYGTAASGNLRLSPTDLWVSPTDGIKLGRRVASGGSAPIARVMISEGTTSIGGGGFILKDYLNRITGTRLNINIHPDMPAGTMLFTTSTLPYALNGIPQPIRILTRQEYYAIEWPRITRKYEYGVYADEVLQAYFPPSLGVLTGVALT